MKPLRDRFGRIVNGLRLAVTSDCNLNCFYCHGEGQRNDGSGSSGSSGGDASKQQQQQQQQTTVIMTIDEIEMLAKIARKFGFDEIKLTGGEPLLRHDIVELINRLSDLGFRDISMTTNGILLSKFAEELHEAGLHRVNISLDTLKPERYVEITGGTITDLKLVMDGIRAGIDAKLLPIKINMVLLNGLNTDELHSMIKFVASYNNIITLQLIELVNIHPDDGSSSKVGRYNSIFHKYHFDLRKVETLLKAKAIRIVRRNMHWRRRYYLPVNNTIVCVEVVRPVHNLNFCKHCTRLRVTADGKLKLCLYNNIESIDFSSYYRAGATVEQLYELFKLAVKSRTPYYYYYYNNPSHQANKLLQICSTSPL